MDTSRDRFGPSQRRPAPPAAPAILRRWPLSAVLSAACAAAFLLTGCGDSQSFMSAVVADQPDRSAPQPDESTPPAPEPAAPAPPQTPVPSPATPSEPQYVPPAPATSAAPSAPSGCDPNYSECVPVAFDVDCAGGSGNGPAYVQGPVQVIGGDPYGLDRDNDGIGCE